MLRLWMQHPIFCDCIIHDFKEKINIFSVNFSHNHLSAAKSVGEGFDPFLQNGLKEERGRPMAAPTRSIESNRRGLSLPVRCHSEMARDPLRISCLRGQYLRQTRSAPVYTPGYLSHRERQGKILSKNLPKPSKSVFTFSLLYVKMYAVKIGI